MFCYERLVAESRPLRTALTAEAAAHVLRQRELRFVSADKPVRFPAQGDALPAALRQLEREDPAALTRAVHVLEHPTLRVPTSTPPSASGGERTVGVATVIKTAQGHELVVLHLGVTEGNNRFRPLEGLSMRVETATTPDDAKRLLEELHRSVPPPAHRMVQKAESDILSLAWVGGKVDGTIMPYEAVSLLDATAAVRGARITIFAEPGRRPREVLTSLKTTVFGIVAVWTPHAQRCEEIVRYASDHPDIYSLFLNEWKFEEARLTLCSALEEISTSEAPAPTPLEPGGERFYIKVGPSKAGDRMIRVSDCGHNKWSDDAREKAPQARKGIERLEQHDIAHLSLCASCNKHRWRARF